MRKGTLKDTNKTPWKKKYCQQQIQKKNKMTRFDLFAIEKEKKNVYFILSEYILVK